jgi:DNA-binding NtrC family response regulator
MKTGALLCVDDDLGILEFYGTLLASEGYEVLLARHARQALQRFDSRKDEIAAVMSDYSMPDMNGLELAAELKRRDPRVPVILISGCQPVLPENHRGDVSLPKGAPLQTLLNQIESLANPKRAGQFAVTKAAAAAAT